MSTNVQAIVGSGTLPFTRAILSPAQRGAIAGAEGIRTGIQVMLGNPEDLTSVDAFAASGITVGTTPTKIWGASQSPLPRTRTVKIQNGSDSSTLLIAHTPAKVVSEGWQLVNGAATVGPRASIELPVLDCVEIWAAASTGTVAVKLLIF